MALIETHQLTKLYRMGTSIVHALDGVDVRIERGDFLAITGPSGSGKSTMMHLLGCLDRPTEGRYLLDGRDVSDLSDRELAVVRNRQIGFVFQTFNLINRTTALENVAVPQFYARCSNTRAAAMRALERVGLAHRAQHNPNELSGGERQRVAIARAIVNDPAVLLADEPTGNLDSKTGEQILAIFRDLSAAGVTIIIVTHEPTIARQARRVIQMHDGRIVADRPTSGAAPPVVPPVDEPASDSPGQPLSEAAAPVAGAVPATVGSFAIRRRMRGATAGLTCGLVAVLMLVAAVLGQQVAARLFVVGPVDPARPPTLSVPAVLAGLGILGGLLTALVLGIVGVVSSMGARRRLRTEPGYWTGGRRALVGLVLGWIAIVTSVGVPVVSIALGLLRRAGP